MFFSPDKAVSAPYIKIALQNVPRAVNQYEKLEVNIKVKANVHNPSDQEEIDVTAQILTPNGSDISVPAFYTGTDDIWQIRYAPAEAGVHSVRASISQGGNTLRTAPKKFNVSRGSSDGFLRISRDNGRYLVFDSGKSFFGIGHNLAWVTNNNLNAYRDYLKRMSDNGCNLTRLWINMPWTIRIESSKIGKFDPAEAKKLDELLSAAKERGIYIILVMDSYSSLMKERGFWDEQAWNSNPYNIANGGMCENPLSIFKDRDAVKSYKNRIRYIIARWGYSTNIAAFELWNEMDAPADWVEEMASYIKKLNPHGQLVTTSIGYPWGNIFDESQIWKLGGIDFIDKHVYGDAVPDTTDYIINLANEMVSRYKKPMLVCEFGMHTSRNDAELDSKGEGRALHKSIWSSMAGGCMSSALNWWWSEYVRPKNMYYHYAALRKFADTVDWAHGKVRTLDIASVTISDAAKNPSKDVTIKTVDAWGDTAYSDFTIGDNGQVSGGFINRYLHGASKKDMAIEPAFHVNFPDNGKMILHIDMVSQGACLVASVDGNDILTRELTAGPGCGPWKRSLYRKDDKVYQCVYDTDVEIDVPKGKHVIKLSNKGMDWLSIKTMTLKNYKSASVANIYAAGTLIGDTAVLWLCNRDYDWKNDRKDVNPELIRGPKVELNGIDDGRYSIEWWDTFAGKVIETNTIESDRGRLLLPAPDFSKDIACKIAKRGVKYRK